MGHISHLKVGIQGQTTSIVIASAQVCTTLNKYIDEYINDEIFKDSLKK